ncbi:peptidase [Bacteroidia bacterium]|nr:peptidase [Bacteroidia bacterium]
MRIRIIFILLVATLSVSAQSIRTRELETKRKQLLSEIENTSNLLSENKKTTTNVLNQLNMLAQQINTRKELVTVLGREIHVLDEEIQFKELQIRNLEKSLKVKKEKYGASIQMMYKQKNNQSSLLFILSAKDFAQSFRRVIYLKEYASWRKKQAGEILVQQQKIITEKKILEKSRGEKEHLVAVKQNEEKKLHIEEDNRKTEVAVLKKDAKKMQADLTTKKKQADALNRQIEKIIAEEIAAAQKAAKAQPKTQRKAETTGGYAMTKEEQNLSTDFSANRGRLPFPLKGNYRIVGYFGQQQHEELKNVVYNSNGIDIKTTSGNTAKVVFNGVVTRIFVVPGFQTSVIVRHGNYLTLYAYLEQVYVKQGETVKTGQDIGKIYTDREDGSTILHFEIWKEQTKLNPSLWLNR